MKDLDDLSKAINEAKGLIADGFDEEYYVVKIECVVKRSQEVVVIPIDSSAD